MQNYAHLSAVQLAESRGIFGLISPYCSGGSVLDYGCGTGMFLCAAHECGFRRNVGADISTYALGEAKKFISADDQLVNLTSESLPQRTFEVVALIDSLTALDDPVQFLSECHDAFLSKNGILVIRTPRTPVGLRTFAARFPRVCRWLGIHPFFAPRRVVLFTESVLEHALRRSGFVVLQRVLRRELLLGTESHSLKGMARMLLKYCESCLCPSMLFIAKRREDVVGV